MQSAVILIPRSHPRLKTFKLQQTKVACLMVSETKLIVNHHSFGSYKTKQVRSSINCLPLCPMRTNDYKDYNRLCCRIKAIPIIITIACRSSNKKQYSSSGGQNSLYWLNISETAQTQKRKLPLLKRMQHGELKNFQSKNL